MADTSVSYKCPNCGAPLSFLPGKKTVSCQYCNAEFEAATLDEIFHDKNERAAHTFFGWTEDEIKNFRAFTCSSCGAELVCDENTMATECVYCGNPTMIPKRFDGMLKPKFIIPFKKTKEDAVTALKNFYKGKYLLPSGFTANNRVEAIQAMYVPFWLFDATISAQAEFKAEKIHKLDVGKTTVTEKKIFDSKREGTMSFEKIPADGSKKMDDDYMDSIEPFDFSELVPFSASYFAGYLADKYDVSAEECTSRADERIRNSAIKVFSDDIRGILVGDKGNVTTKYINFVRDAAKVNYAMLPVWILTTRYKDKPYTFMMNGQTGKVVGELPYSFIKSIVYPALIALLSFPIFYLFYLLVSD